MPRVRDQTFRAAASARRLAGASNPGETGARILRAPPPYVPAVPHAFRLKLERYARLTGRAPEVAGLLLKSSRGFDPGMHLLRQGEPAGQVFIIKQGWTFTGSSRPDGARQVHDVQIPGDVAGLPNYLMPFTLNDVTAITRVEVFEIKADRLAEATAEDPELLHFLLWLLSRDIAVAGEHLIGIGRRTAIQRTAHFILELATRLRLAGVDTDIGFACPLTQYLLGDTLGLTSVHVNRTMRALRTAGLVQHHCGWIRLPDKARLANLAMFDSTYLDCATQSPSS